MPIPLRRWTDDLRGNRLWLLVAVVLAIGFYGFNALHYGKLPLRIEERVWPPMAEAVFRTAKPVLPADKMRRVRFDSELRVDESPLIGAWHPPLYLYTVAASMTVIGTDSPGALRAVGILGLLTAAALLALIAREVTTRWRLVGAVAAVLLLTHPYAIQGSLFLDIDTAIYMPLALLATWLAIRYGKTGKPLTGAQLLTLGASLALVTWAKMTTTIVLAGALCVWWLLSRRPLGRASLEALGFVSIGAALFFSTYAAWCALTDIPFSYTFEVTFADKSNRFLGDWLLVEHAAKWHLRWFGAALLLLSLTYLVDMARAFRTARRLRPMDLPFLVGAGILVLYILVSPTDGTYQGKYAFPALGMLLLPVSWMLLRRPDEASSAGRWGIAIAIAAALAMVVPDSLTGLSQEGDYGSWGFALSLLTIAGGALGCAWLLGGSRGFSGGVVAVLVALSLAQAVDIYRANTSPLYPIPDTTDFLAAAHELNRTLGPGDIALVAKDLGFYVEGPIIEGEDAFARGDGRTAAVIRRYPQVRAFARDSFGPPLGPKTQAVLDRCFNDVTEIGSASVAYRSGDCDEPALSRARP